MRRDCWFVFVLQMGTFARGHHAVGLGAALRRGSGAPGRPARRRVSGMRELTARHAVHECARAGCVWRCVERGVPAEAEPATTIERARPIPAKRVDFFMTHLLLSRKSALLASNNGPQPGGVDTPGELPSAPLGALTP